MKNITITADWILSLFHHTGWFPGDGSGSIYCDSSDFKWNQLVFESNDIQYEIIEYEDKHGFEFEFKFIISDIKEIAPIFHAKCMEIHEANKNNKNRGESV